MIRNAPSSATLTAACFLAGAALTSAQPWETLLPHPDATTGDLATCSCAGGRSVLIDPAPSPDALTQVYVGTVRYDNTPTVLRLTPDNPAFPAESMEEVDGETSGGLAWVPRIVRIDGHGLFAIGRYTAKVSGSTTYRWKVRTSPTGDPGTWIDVDNFTYNTKSSSESNPHGITASATHIFVSGMAYDGRNWRWIVRSKELGSTQPADTVMDVATPTRLESPICYFSGNANNSQPAVLAAGVTATTVEGKTVHYWTVRRSIDGGATFPEQQTWTPASYTHAIPLDIACEPGTGNIYAVGGLGGYGVLPNEGWVLRVNRFGGLANKWETLIEDYGQGGAGHRIAFGAGTVAIVGRIDPTRAFPVMNVIHNIPGQAWANSQPFAGFQCGSRMAIDADDSGAFYVTGDVIDYVDAGGNAFPGTRLALSRWIPTP